LTLKSRPFTIGSAFFLEIIMGGHKTIRSTSYGTPPLHIPPPPTPDYIVTGELTPDATGNYFEAGVYGGKPYYRRADGTYFIWWSPDEEDWSITRELGDVGVDGFWFSTTIPSENFAPAWPATGIATVTAG